MRATLRVFCLAVFILSWNATAHAEPFTILPNGDLVFNVSLSSNGLFTCGSVVSCSGSGTNSIVLQSGSGTATFTFTGLNASIAVGNTTTPVTLGTFEGSTTAGFALPDGLNPNVGLLFFNFTISHTSPVDATGLLGWRFGPTFTRMGEEGNTYLQFPIGQQPPQYHYSSIIYTMRVFPLTLPLNGSKDLVADVGVVPEPGSIALVSTGLVGAWWRRRKRVKAPIYDQLEE